MIIMIDSHVKIKCFNGTVLINDLFKVIYFIE